MAHTAILVRVAPVKGDLEPVEGEVAAVYHSASDVGQPDAGDTGVYKGLRAAAEAPRIVKATGVVRWVRAALDGCPDEAKKLVRAGLAGPRAEAAEERKDW